MPRPASKTVFVLVPGASQSPAHYGYLLHLLLTRGHPAYSAILPSTGSNKNVTAQDDADYVREQMLLPILDTEQHNVIMIMHSYSGVPGSAAALGLGKKERAAAGKSTSVLGQIYIASLLIKGGDGGDIVTALGGQLPPHISPNKPAGILTCDDPAPSLYGDVTPKEFQDAIVMSTLCPSYAAWHSPCPRTSWDSEAFKGRIAFVRTLKDTGIPLEIQDMVIKGTGEEWIVKDVDTGHSPNLSAPEKLCDILEELGKQFESM